MARSESADQELRALGDVVESGADLEDSGTTRSLHGAAEHSKNVVVDGKSCHV